MTDNSRAEYLTTPDAAQAFAKIHKAAQDALSGIVGSAVTIQLGDYGSIEPDGLSQLNKNVLLELEFERPQDVHHGLLVLADAVSLTTLFSLAASEDPEEILVAESLLSLGDIASTFLDTAVSEFSWLQPTPRAWLANLEPIITDMTGAPSVPVPASLAGETRLNHLQVTLTTATGGTCALDIVMGGVGEQMLLGVGVGAPTLATATVAAPEMMAGGDDDWEQEATPMPVVEQVGAAVGGGAAQQQSAQASPPPVQAATFKPLGADQSVGRSSGIDLIRDVPLRVSVELGRASLTVREILALGAGSIVELDRLAGEPADVLVNDRLIAHGEVVIVDESFGVRITELIRDEGRRGA